VYPVDYEINGVALGGSHFRPHVSLDPCAPEERSLFFSNASCMELLMRSKCQSMREKQLIAQQLVGRQFQRSLVLR
jgi:hypothetical protein